MTAERYRSWRDEELTTLRTATPEAPWDAAAELLDELVLSGEYATFLTLVAYGRLG